MVLTMMCHSNLVFVRLVLQRLSRDRLADGFDYDVSHQLTRLVLKGSNITPSFPQDEILGLV